MRSSHLRSFCVKNVWAAMCYHHNLLRQRRCLTTYLLGLRLQRGTPRLELRATPHGAADYGQTKKLARTQRLAALNTQFLIRNLLESVSLACTMGHLSASPHWLTDDFRSTKRALRCFYNLEISFRNIPPLTIIIVLSCSRVNTVPSLCVQWLTSISGITCISRLL